MSHILHPGKERDDELLYGSGRTSDPVHSGDTTAGHHMDPLAGNVNKPLPHTPAGFTGAPVAGSTHGTAGGTTITCNPEVNEYHLDHTLHPTNPPPLADPRIADVIEFGHTPVGALKAAIEAPVLSPVSNIPTIPVAGHIASVGSKPLLGGQLPPAVPVADHTMHSTHTTGTTSTTTTGGPHVTGLGNHPGQDAAVLGGATAGGVAGYGAGTQYDDPSRLSGPLDSSTAGPYSGTTAPYSSNTGVHSSNTGVHSSNTGVHSSTTSGTDSYLHEEKKNTGFLDMLHRNKDTHDDVGHQQPYSTTGTTGITGTTGTTGVGQDTYDGGHHERNRLHKDPPRELLEQQGLSTNDQYVSDPNTAGRY